MTVPREYQRLRISNVFPMDLNFLLYVENLYECHYGGKEVFPGGYLIRNNQELLEAKCFIEVFQTLWYELVFQIKLLDRDNFNHIGFT